MDVDNMYEGFSFENCLRNTRLAEKGLKAKPYNKTGTTIVGLMFKDGVVLGADTRATGGSTVLSKDCEKLHYLAPNMYCAGAGTAADMVMVGNMIAGQLNLHSLNTDRPPRVVTALTMLSHYLYKYQGYIGCHLIVGGWDITGPQLYSIDSLGHYNDDVYATMGSGMMAAKTVFDARFKLDMEMDDAIKLTADAVAAGILNDMGSGGTVNICVITKDKTEYLDHYRTICSKGPRQGDYTVKPGTTSLISSDVIQVVSEAMET